MWGIGVTPHYINYRNIQLMGHVHLWVVGTLMGQVGGLSLCRANLAWLTKLGSLARDGWKEEVSAQTPVTRDGRTYFTSELGSWNKTEKTARRIVLH